MKPEKNPRATMNSHQRTRRLALTASLLLVALAGCGDTQSAGDPSDTDTPPAAEETAAAEATPLLSCKHTPRPADAPPPPEADVWVRVDPALKLAAKAHAVVEEPAMPPPPVAPEVIRRQAEFAAAESAERARRGGELPEGEVAAMKRRIVALE